MSGQRSEPSPAHVVIVGGGIAGMEAALAFHHLAPDLAHVTLVSPEPEFHYKPMAVDEPFSMQPAERRALGPALHELQTEFVEAAVTGIEAPGKRLRLANGETLGYDILLVALGGRAHPAFSGAETFWAGRSDLAIDELLSRAAESAGRTLAFVVPMGCSWPLPLYELALMTRRRVEERGPYGVRIRLITPEDSALGIFGEPASAAVEQVLSARGIELETMRSVIEEDGELHVHPGGEPLEAGAVVALPVIEGPALPGLPSDEHGFIPVDLNLRVPGTTDVYAAGDGTTFPVKQGGLATQQADAAVEHIASGLGANVTARPFDPVLRGQLITGPDSLNMKHHLTGGHGEGGASLDYLWWPPGKVAGRYLAPWIAGTSLDEELEPPARPLEVEISLPHEWHAQPMAMGSHPNPTR